jgi:hypothetical protein
MRRCAGVSIASAHAASGNGVDPAAQSSEQMKGDEPNGARRPIKGKGERLL